MQTIKTNELNNVTGGQVVSRSSSLNNTTLTTFLTQIGSQLQQAQLQNQNGLNNPMFLFAMMFALQGKNKSTVVGPGFYSWSA